MAPRNASKTVRERARDELTSEIKASARRQLAEVGAEALSLRAVARDLGMVSSALYRYFPSRDALLTELIIDAYNALGEACEVAESAVDREDYLGRWRSIAFALRRWSVAHPHEYALIYGTPVPGFAAPDDTIDPATRISQLLLILTVDIEAAGLPMAANGAPVTPLLVEQLVALTDALTGPVDQRRLLCGLGAWAMLFGMISFELFGTFHNTFDDAEPLFAHQVDLAAHHMGLGPS